MKRYVILAGVNGAGKSTLFSLIPSIGEIEKINLDEVVRQIGDWKNTQDVIKAGKLVVSRINRYFDNGISFSQETTLCGHSIFKNIKRAKGLGYRIEMYYVGLDSVDIAKQRIKARVMRGGHGIPDEDVEKRYVESLRNLSIALHQCDIVTIYDNTEHFQRFAVYEQGELVRITERVPRWYQVLLK